MSAKWLLIPAALLTASLASIRMHAQTVALGYRVRALTLEKARLEQEVARQQCRVSQALSPVQVYRRGKDMGLRIEASVSNPR